MSGLTWDTSQMPRHLAVCNFLRGYTSPAQLDALYYAACGIIESENPHPGVTEGFSLEIGCLYGRSSVAIAYGLLDLYYNSGHGIVVPPEDHRKLICVDPFKAAPGERICRAEMEGHAMDRQMPVEAIFKENMALARAENYVLHRCTSEEARERGYVSGPLRFAFIDGDHTYEGVKHDIEWVLDLAAPGAIVACDDYGLNEGVDLPEGVQGWGVKRAVDELLVPRCSHVHRCGPNGVAWFGRLA